ncbi:MAG: MAPEG family protein [Panacagrimonas sp.]
MTEPSPILAPVMALVMWSLVMWWWMYVTRVPAIMKSGMVMDATLPNGQQLSELPARVRWKADNYNHLMELPTLFYAVALVLAVAGDTSALGVNLAWAYVASRVVHSLFQALVNKIEVRFGIFVVSSLILMALTAHAACVVW